MMLTASKNNWEKKQVENLQNLCFYTKPDKKEKIWLAFESIYFFLINRITIYCLLWSKFLR